VLSLTQIDGTSRSRADELHPIDCSLVNLHSMSALCFGSLGGIYILGLTSGSDNDSADLIFHAIFGTLCCFLSLCSAVILICNFLNAYYLSKLSLGDLRRRLAKCSKQARFQASTSGLRGFTVGVFFRLRLQLPCSVNYSISRRRTTR